MSGLGCHIVGANCMVVGPVYDRIGFANVLERGMWQKDMLLQGVV